MFLVFTFDIIFVFGQSLFVDDNGITIRNSWLVTALILNIVFSPVNTLLPILLLQHHEFLHALSRITLATRR